MGYKQRVEWSEEEEEILLDALNKRIETGKNINLELVCSILPSLHEKYITDRKVVGNKLASLKNAPSKYRPRSKWTIEEEMILLDAIIESIKTNAHIKYSTIVQKHQELSVKYKNNPQSIKNKVISLKKKYIRKLP
jgi:hypothetical protein